jgi:ABC-type multidrug transport system fused ATPase/permease subunit
MMESKANLVRQLWDLLRPKERRQLIGLGFCMLMMAILETAGVASILPFMQVVTNPGLIQGNSWLSALYDWLDFSSTQMFLLFLGIAVLVAISLNNAFSAFTTWIMYRFAWSQNHRLSTRLLAKYLNQPYTFFLARNTAELSKNILSEVQIAIQGVMLAALKFVCRLLIVLLIVALLAIIDPLLAVIVGLALGGAYGIVYLLLRRKQRRLGRERLYQNGRRFQMAGEALAGIKELKVLGREQTFLKRFKEPSSRFCRAAASNQLVSALPRYALETIAFGGVLLIILYSLRNIGSTNDLLPLLSVYVFAGYRLMPSLNELFTSAIQMRFNRASLEDLHEDFGQALSEVSWQEWAKRGEEAVSLPLREFLELRDVSYTYPGAPAPALEFVNMAIQRNQVIGLVGETGAGKTTLGDLILGLLEPTSGTIEVDGVPLTPDNRRAWRRSCGYIPQEIFLSDDTIRANIAFGVPEELIDDAAVTRAARIARIDDFIETLPERYHTEVGERGVRLSGGQRQRIGIARALYHDPHVIVMDEATSSLDGATEAAVMEMIHKLGRVKTLLIIAHRLSTVRACDLIYLVRDGGTRVQGTYEDLASTSRYFRAMGGLETIRETSKGEIGEIY